MCVKRLQWCWRTGLVTGPKCLTETIINLDLNTVSENLLVMSVAREFQTVGAVQRKARSAERIPAWPELSLSYRVTNAD